MRSWLRPTVTFRLVNRRQHFNVSPIRLLPGNHLNPTKLIALIAARDLTGFVVLLWWTWVPWTLERCSLYAAHLNNYASLVEPSIAAILASPVTGCLYRSLNRQFSFAVIGVPLCYSHASKRPRDWFSLSNFRLTLCLRFCATWIIFRWIIIGAPGHETLYIYSFV